MISTQWLVFALAAPLLWSINNITDRIFITKIVKNEYAITFAAGMLRIFYFLILLLTSGWFLPRTTPLLIALLAGFFSVIAIIFYFKALAREETVPAILVFDAANPCLVLLLSVLFLNEKFTIYSILGFILLLLASILSSIKLGEKIKFRSGIIFMLIAVVFWGVSDIMYKYIMPEFPSVSALLAWVMLGGFIGSFIMLIPFGSRKLFSVKDFNWGKNTWIIFTLVAFLSFFGYFFFFKAIEIGSVTLTTVVSNIQTLFIFILELILFYLSRFLPSRLRFFEKVDLSKNSLLPKVAAFICVVSGIFLLQI